MINDVFINMDRKIGSALYADDGTTWVRKGDPTSVKSKIKEAIRKIEQWSYNWGFRMPY